MAKGVVTGSLISVFMNDDDLFSYFAEELEITLTAWMHQHMDPKAQSVAKVPADWAGRLISKLKTKVTQSGNSIHIEMGLLESNRFEKIRALTLDTGSSPVGKPKGVTALDVHVEEAYASEGRMVGLPVPGKDGKGWLTETEGELLAALGGLVNQALANAALRTAMGNMVDVQGHHMNIKMNL